MCGNFYVFYIDSRNGEVHNNLRMMQGKRVARELSRRISGKLFDERHQLFAGAGPKDSEVKEKRLVAQ